jgi:hypothetical protein
MVSVLVLGLAGIGDIGLGMMKTIVSGFCLVTGDVLVPMCFS